MSTLMVRACLVGLGILAGASWTAAAGAVTTWRVTEISLVSKRAYANSYKDVTITASFTGPRGQAVTREAFWCGKNLWKVRFAPPAPGTWTWKTTCSDTKNAALHERAGSIECQAYDGTLPLSTHGFIRVSDNSRHFTHADGTPFFWLGDTHWQMPDTERVDACNHPAHRGKACPFGGQFQHLLADRKAKGFSVYQTYPLAVDPAWWTSPHTQINPERFASVFDVQMDALARQGFVIALGFGHYNDSVAIPADDLRRWGRYLVARYGAHPVVWITCQEMNMPDGGGNRLASWQAIARDIAQADGYRHPLSGHQVVVDVGTLPLGGEPWHTWFALQGGHRNVPLTPQQRYAGYYAFRPTKPIVETEAMYEELDCCGAIADARDARTSAWKAMLCGCAGYTYGAAGVWALKWDPADTRWKDYNYRTPGWYAGMALPGSAQMRVLKDFFLRLPWPALTPRFSDPAWASWQDP
ncbi:MAG: DUF5060 domain-containing protein, partial [Planctomycetota bacterium]|nr:DUF5060 domain-containing protein [Planctomycetota bacterium]